MPKQSKRITMHDVARAASVSVATVSYTLNGNAANRSRIGSATRERVLAAVEDLGYVPHQSAQSLRKRATNRICLSVPRLGVPYYDVLARELQREGEALGLHLFVSVGRDAAGASSVLQHVQGGLADALVMIMERRPSEELTQRLEAVARLGVATVVVGNHVHPAGVDVVREGDDRACVDAVRHLVERGHRRIGCVALELDSGELHARYESYRRALSEAGIGVDERLVRTGAGNRQEAFTSAGDLLRADEPPSAIFACTDVAALSAMRAAREAGLRVPDDVAIIGAGDIAEGEFADPPLSTVGPETRDFADVSELLFDRLRSRDAVPGRSRIKRWTLKVRGST